MISKPRSNSKKRSAGLFRISPTGSVPSGSVEFRRISNLPPYVFTIIDSLKVERRREGADVIDLGFGNLDIPSPITAVKKLSEAAENERNHRYSASRGIPKLREAVADLYRRQWDVELDPETEIINTIGAKEGFFSFDVGTPCTRRCMFVPAPSYPIHIFGPLFTGQTFAKFPLTTGEDF